MVAEKDIGFIGTAVFEELDEYQKNKVEWLLNTNYNYETKRSYYSVLDSRIHALEVALNKDLYKFTQVEIENIIKGVNSFSVQTAQALFSMINSYIQWTVEIGLNNKGENPCNKIIIKDVVKVNSNALKELYTTKEEFYYNIMSLEGSIIDKTIIMLLRYGVRLIDIPNLRYEDVNADDMTLKVESDGGILNIPIDELLLRCIKECKSTDEYERLSNKRDTVTKYMDFGYIIKVTDKGYSRSGEEKINTRTIHTRIKKLFDENGLQKINVNSLKNMAMFDILLDIYEEHGKLTFDDADNVIKTFDNIDNNNLKVKSFRLRELFTLVSDIKFFKK